MKSLKWLFAGILLVAVVYFSWAYLQQQGVKSRQTTITDTLALFSKTKILQTASLDVQKDITGQDSLMHLLPGVGIDDLVNSSLFGGNMTLHVEGRVNAGIRLESLTTGNIVAHTDKTVDLILPIPEVIGVQVVQSNRLAPALSLTQADKALEQQLRNKMQETLLQEALDSGLLLQAKTATTQELQKLLTPLHITLGKVSFKQ